MEEIFEREEKITERIEESTENTRIKSESIHISKIKVGAFHEAPEYLRDNEYIKQGYRLNCNNSVKHVFKSLFILHNESVNIWSHLIGAILVIILIVYTTIFIKSHKNDLMNTLHVNMTHVNEEFNHVTDSMVRLLPNLKNFTSEIGEKYEDSKIMVQHYTEKIINKSNDIIDFVDQKIGFYQKYFNCENCLDDIIETLGGFKNTLGDHYTNYKDKLVNNSIHLFEQIEPVLFIEDINLKLENLKCKIGNMFDSADMSWVDIYAAESNQKEQRLTRWPIFVMLIGAIICLSCSAIFHWFSAHSIQIHHILSRLDYAGISILIAGSCYPPYYYFFYCEPTLRITYLSFISTFAISVFFYSLTPSFANPENRRLRGTLFLTLGLSTALPIIHLSLFADTVKGYDALPNLMYWYIGGVCYVTGALIYIMRIPEKCRPGKHCIWGSSHQIFHFFVLAGVIFHYFGSLDSYYYRINYSCPI